MRYLVKFIDIGRYKRCFEREFRSVSESALKRAIEASGVLMSHSIDVILDENGKTGHVMVGGLREVGWLEIVDREQEQTEQAISA